jgi:hypothetical protein
MRRARYRSVLYSAPCRSSRPDINEYEFQSGYTRELLLSEHGRNGPVPAEGNSPLRQVLAAPGGDAGLLARCTPGNSNVLAGFLAGEVRAAARSRYTVARTSRLYRLQRIRGRHGNLGIPESAHSPGRLSPGRPEIIYDYPRHFPELLPSASSRGRPGGLRTGPAGAVIRAGAGVQERGLGPHSGMIVTARIPGRPDQI